MPNPREARASIGLLCALPEELGPLAELPAEGEPVAGLVLRRTRLAGAELIMVVAGVGKVRAAQGAALLVAGGAREALLVVGVCGAISAGLEPGQLVHCSAALQTDFAVRGDREFTADPSIMAAWRAGAPGPVARFLTSDRPVMSHWRRLRARRSFSGSAVADMETASAAAVAQSAGVPWGALRAVTDRAGTGAVGSFKQHFPTQAGRAAATVPALIGQLVR